MDLEVGSSVFAMDHDPDDGDRQVLMVDGQAVLITGRRGDPPTAYPVSPRRGGDVAGGDSHDEIVVGDVLAGQEDQF
eukprot:COSAG05_NODE_17745_length_320_cov_0.588235_2_plen_76_part_01